VATQVEICNAALTHLGAKTLVTSLAENSKEAQRLAAVWNSARDKLLTAHRWGFARRQIALALAAGASVAGWEYVYALPSDCLDARELYHASLAPAPHAFALSANADDSGLWLLTDTPEAELVYTARIETVTRYPAPFAEALAWELADRVAMPLTADLQLKQLAAAQARIALDWAKAADANQQVHDPARSPDWLTARA
jgi:hypothetical protein